MHTRLAYRAYDLGVSAEADGTPARLIRLTQRGQVTAKSIRRHRSRARDFPLTFPLQAYISTLDYSESRKDRETGYVSLQSYR